MESLPSAPTARREGYVFPEVEQAVLWDALVCRLRALRRYRAYVEQDIRPLWLAFAGVDKTIDLLPSHALMMRRPFEVPGSPGWLYFQKLARDPAREFGIVAEWGGTPYKLMTTIHLDAAAREIAASERILAERSAEQWHADDWIFTRTCAGNALADALGSGLGVSLDIEPTRLACYVAGPDDPVYGEPTQVESIRIDVPLSEGVAFDDDYWARLERTAVETLRRGLSRMRQAIEDAEPPRRRPTSLRNALADLDPLFAWLVLRERPAARTDRIRLRRLAHRLGLLAPGEAPRDDEYDDECEDAT